jgi:beta-ribofuranosylaminobenzene 5'-phosphate synthase
MTGRVVRVVAPSRIHFGMLSVNQPGMRHYGGVGAMVDAPGLEIVIRAAPRLETAGPLAERVRQAALLAARSLPARGGENDGLRCRIEVTRAPPLHVGLGTGTQLAMAVAAGLNAWWEGPTMDAAGLARCVGRGHRSAIGLHGFVFGGLLYESGKAGHENVAPLVDRVDIPPAWRFVLVRPRDERGLYDEAERDAFADLPPVPVERTEMLCQEATGHLLPAAREGRFAEFSESLYRFGYAAGLSFAAKQGGAFAGPRLTELVDWIRARGVAGVGQSSWGPTLLAVLPDEPAAADLARRLGTRPDVGDLDLVIASPNNHGARIESLADV